MIITLKKVLSEARDDGHCVPAINVYNLETVQAVLYAARDSGYPIIVAFGEGYIPYAPLKVIAAMVKALDTSDTEIVLHLDHAKKLATIKDALSCGFSSVMYDGSSLSLEENIANTRKVVEMASYFGASVEGELGYLNAETGDDGLIFTDCYTSVEEAEQFVSETGVDALAIAVGNAHGLYLKTPKVDFDRIAAINRATKVPLVLHGSSGIPEEAIKTAISLGIAKINVNTEVSMAGAAAAFDLLGKEQQVRYEKLTEAAREEMVKVVNKFMLLAYG